MAPFAVTVVALALLLKVTTALAPVPRPLIVTGVAAASALFTMPFASPKAKAGEATVKTVSPFRGDFAPVSGGQSKASARPPRWRSQRWRRRR